MGRAQSKTEIVRGSFALSAFWIVDQLIEQGVEQFCISPGSRSTPLALAVAEHPKAKAIVHFDERGIGFYALGYAKASGKPAAVIVTSGTAVGNLMPSVMEAHHSFTPMILLTADRPIELRDCSANQTTDQTKFFHQFVRWQTDLPPSGSETYFRSTTAQAVFWAMQNFPGPVQINCAFKEPFYPPKIEPSFGTPISHYFSRMVPPLEALHSNASRGIIVIGRIPCDPRPILKLAARLKWPVFADLLSQARCFPTVEQIKGYDAILKSECPLKPDLILHFGERVLSKTILNWNQSSPWTHISPYPVLQDPERRVSVRVQCDIELFSDRFQAKTNPSWLQEWKRRETMLPSHPLTVPKGWAVFLGNSMPIRDAENYLYPDDCAGFFCNRGLSGIDGNIATAAGLAEGLQKPLIALIGDQTCLHDLNSIPLLKQSRFPIHLIVENNFGGQIFTRLPISKSPHFDRFWTASHNWGFEGIAKMFGLSYVQSETIPDTFPENSSLIEWISAEQLLQSEL